MLRIRGSQGRHGGKLAIALLLLGVLAFVSPLPRASYAVTSLILDTSSPSALHQSTTDCAVAGGSWSNGTLTCTVTGTGAIYSGGFLSVQSGATLDITPGADFHAFGDVGVVLGAIKIGENANLSIGSSGRLDNSEANGACGSVTNNGNISNEGTIGSSCTFVNKGEIDNLDGAFIYAGSYGGAGATFDNQGTIINSHGGALQDDSNGTGVLNNAGTIVNDGFLQLYSGDTVMAQGRNGHWYFQGSFASSGNLQMSSGSTLTVGYGGYTTVPTTLDITSGTFRIPYGVTLYVASSAKLFVDAEAAIDNYGYLSLQSGQAFYRAGNVTNSGVITNYNGGTVNDNGTITNEEGATVNNTSGADFVSRGYDGIMYNHGAFYNGKEGIVDLQAYAIINNDGPIEDAGTFAISENATLTNNSGGRVSVNGTLDNSGTVSNNGGGVLNVNGFLSNSGVVNSSAGASIRVNPRGAVNSTGIIRSSGSFKILPGATVATGAGGLLATSGSLIDSGTLNVAQEASLNIDAGTVDINGSLDSSGSMRLSLPAVVRVDTQGKMSNAGVFGNFGGLYIEAGGTLTNVQGGAINTANILNNLGTVDNSAGATINNNKGGNISLYGFSYTNNAGAMNNGAAITKYCRAVMYTPGTLTGNPVTIVSCSSLRTTATSIRLSTSSVGVKQTISINATVVDTSTGAKALPTGALAWSDGKAGGVFALSGICTLSKGSCAISYAAPSAGGTITLNATYEGDMVHQPSSTAAQLTVTSQGTSTSTAGSSSSTSATSGTGAPAGGGGIPEFPAQLPGVAILTAFIVVAYLSLRRRVTG